MWEAQAQRVVHVEAAERMEAMSSLVIMAEMSAGGYESGLFNWSSQFWVWIWIWPDFDNDLVVVDIISMWE